MDFFFYDPSPSPRKIIYMLMNLIPCTVILRQTSLGYLEVGKKNLTPASLHPGVEIECFIIFLSNRRNTRKGELHVLCIGILSFMPQMCFTIAWKLS